MIDPEGDITKVLSLVKFMYLKMEKDLDRKECAQ